MTVDLADYDDDFETAKPGTSQRPKIEDLTDGKYEFEIVSGAVKFPKEFCILEMNLRVTSEGAHCGEEFQYSEFVNADRAPFIKGILKALGFDVDLWTKANNRPFSAEFIKVGKCLKGVRFSGRKKTNPGNKGKDFHNLYIDRRTDDDQPDTFGPEQLDTADPDQPFD